MVAFVPVLELGTDRAAKAAQPPAMLGDIPASRGRMRVFGWSCCASLLASVDPWSERYEHDEKHILMSAGLSIASIATLSFGAFAADPFTKDEAVAMVKKEVAAIKAEGPEKAHPEIDEGPRR